MGHHDRRQPAECGRLAEIFQSPLSVSNATPILYSEDPIFANWITDRTGVALGRPWAIRHASRQRAVLALRRSLPISPDEQAFSGARWHVSIVPKAAPDARSLAVGTMLRCKVRKLRNGHLSLIRKHDLAERLLVKTMIGSKSLTERAQKVPRVVVIRIQCV
jgi:hypothetical protein